jgi:ATP-GRASP peptide maturase of grasp-with-spasm system
MIIIFSSNNDYSTQLVIDWLHNYEHTPIIINENNPIVDLCLKIYNKDVSLDIVLKSGKKINSTEINIIWYRRGLNFIESDFKKLLKKAHLKPFHNHLELELETLHTFIFNLFRNKTIGDFEISDNNKLITLKTANSLGLLTPDTIIITNEKDITDSKNLITKNIKDILSTRIKNSLYFNRTTRFERGIKRKLFPSLLQEEIIKKIELRIFYFDGLLYTMAIFSQQNEDTKVDFRDITNQASLKTVPYELPGIQKSKLIKLIKQLGYTSCSIDMLVDSNNNYYFLELNPIGQFSMVSIPCNYYIERDIALKLISYVKKDIKRA